MALACRAWPTSRPGTVVSPQRVRVAVRAVIAVAVVALAAGCATVPSAGAPHVVKGESSQVQAYVLPEPPPAPTSGRQWTPQNVVLGFLNASASFAVDPAAARAYLVPSQRASWHPGAATIVQLPGSITTLPYKPEGPVAPDESANYTDVKFTGQRLATLSESGQYHYTPGSTTYTFTLELVKGVWLIEQLPNPGLLLLTQSDFEAVYQPRNLYYFAPQPSAAHLYLVPDPVFAPIQGNGSALNTTLATDLVNGLLNGHGGSWLSAATTTEFPAGTKLLSLNISGQVAVVNLGGAAAKAEPWQVIWMADQLIATLTAKSGYAAPVVNGLQLEIDGKTQYTGGAQANLVPGVDSLLSAAPVYFTTSTGVSRLGAGARNPVPLLDWAQAGIAGADVSAIAASPVNTPELAVAVADGGGCAVYVGRPGSTPATRFAKSVLSTSGGPCKSLSWDNDGRLWIASADSIWVMQRPGTQPVQVALPDMPGTSAAAYGISALRIAPDGVRAALLVHTAAGNRLLLTAVSYASDYAAFGPAVTIGGSSLADPVAFSWYNPYYLAVLASGAVYQVPLTGGAGTNLGSAPPGAQTISTDGSQIVVGSKSGLVVTSPAASLNWTNLVKGANPSYPG